MDHIEYTWLLRQPELPLSWSWIHMEPEQSSLRNTYPSIPTHRHMTQCANSTRGTSHCDREPQPSDDLTLADSTVDIITALTDVSACMPLWHT